MRVLVAILVFAVALLIVQLAGATTSSQKLQKSESVIAWYEGEGWWHLRPGFERCSQIRWDRPASRCFRHRQGYRFHAERVERLTPKPAVTSASYWAAKQIAAATHLAAHSALDPWPNCPDPKFNGASWQDTVNCENGGNWLDSPGYYRCGLQFDPGWENVYGRLCP
jgi:hypothetical protein